MREEISKAKREIPYTFGWWLGQDMGTELKLHSGVLTFSSLWLFSPSHIRWNPRRPREFTGRCVPYQRHEGASPSGTK